MNSNTINNEAQKLINGFPFRMDNLFASHCSTHELGIGKNFPSTTAFSESRKAKSSHSETFNRLDHIELTKLFKAIEEIQEPVVYVFWATFSSEKQVLYSFDLLLSSKRTKRFKNLTYVNNNNINEHKEIVYNRANHLIPLYVGKSEHDVNGRIICHVDCTGGQYKALKIREHLEEATIYLSLIRLNLVENKKDRKFLNKSLCFTMEYYLATKLKPILGMHK